MKQRLPVLIFALVMAAIPFIPGVPPFWLVLLNNIGLAALVAMGLVLLTGVGGLTSFGQAAFVGLGAYIYYGNPQPSSDVEWRGPREWSRQP